MERVSLLSDLISHCEGTGMARGRTSNLEGEGDGDRGEERREMRAVYGKLNWRDQNGIICRFLKHHL